MKTKRSFFEKITGAKEIDENEPRSMNIFADESEEELTMPTSRPSVPSFAQPEETWGMSTAAASATDAEGQLTIDVYQTENDVVIKSTIAGVKPEDLDVSINNDMVTIRGERKNEEEVTGENYYYQECYWGSFSRSVVMPTDIIPEKAEASLKNGILTIRLPKAATNKVKKIQVRGF
jgi:HSP20 family protein